MRLARVLPLAAALCLALALAGCSVEHRVTGPSPFRPPPGTPPGLLVADSPTNAIRLFGEGWNRRDLAVFEGLLTTDFRFVFALGDSAGNAFRDDPLGRDELLSILERMFDGGGSCPPATRIDLVLDPVLRAIPDSRPGMDPAWHREVLTGVDLTVRLEDGQEYRVLGSARFFVVRGDSARVPPGCAADSTRWYLQLWNDETLGGAVPASRRSGPAGALAPLPTHDTSWGQLLALFRGPPPPPPKGL